MSASAPAYNLSATLIARPVISRDQDGQVIATARTIAKNGRETVIATTLPPLIGLLTGTRTGTKLPMLTGHFENRRSGAATFIPTGLAATSRQAVVAQLDLFSTAA